VIDASISPCSNKKFPTAAKSLSLNPDDSSDEYPEGAREEEEEKEEKEEEEEEYSQRIMCRYLDIQPSISCGLGATVG
jgi:ribosomal protein L12E/L44/L45/RPP1/RPP2